MRFLAVLLLAAAACAHAVDKAPPIPDYPAEQVAAHTWVVHGPMAYPNADNQGFMNNPAFVVTDAGVVVVDPGSSVQTGDMLLRQIRKVTAQPVVAVLNTHVHGDHWLGNHALREAYPEVAIYGHPKMIAAVEKGAGEFWVDNFNAITDGAIAGTRPMGPNVAVDNGDAIRVGEFTFRFHHAGAAHTNNDLMIQVPEEEVLFLADNACNGRIVRMDDGTFTGSVDTLTYAEENIPAKVLVPGHGRTGGWEIVAAYKDYLGGVYAAVEALYDEGMPDYEMKPAVAERLSRFADWNGFEDELGKHISLSYLEVERKAFE